MLKVFANIIAWPTAWYIMTKWLEKFAYRIEISILTFILAGVLAFVITILTVGFQAVKTANNNPVDSLRHE